MTRRLEAEVEKVVRSQNCSGCGGCAQVSAAITMKMDSEGFLRPEFDLTKPTSTEREASEFRKICPGVRVDAPAPQGSIRHPYLGAVVDSWQAWACDPVVRNRGSSGGTLTAISNWIVDSPGGGAVVGAAASPQDPRHTVSLTIMSKDEALRASGSRYAPASNLSAENALHEDAFVGKPCEISSLSQIVKIRRLDRSPLRMSFFCAGVPSQHATNRLVSKLGVGNDSPIASLQYRGDGWPGQFRAQDKDGNVGRMSYDDSWGKELGPTMQLRCKICPDGVGESADIVAGDFWSADEDGYPVFAEQEGVSVLIARTVRGREAVLAAAAAGYLHLEPIDLGSVASVQPLQTLRRRTLCGRLLGRLFAGKRIPNYRGFGLLRFSILSPAENLRAAAGTFRRSI
ncbi:Coenzyme F420 hydrogenase/dehydrogenase, beta subunit C-terminal domain [Rhodococcoides fascians]|uniref:Coenzyme F420 hydrogenase/dehydrogenase, beta subunit C-terminal domain n=1 Tax=Rhodococcoides fascians TaxID=1828 RepID=UPI00050C4522|nr:Coenzyme F420 hydrogenase/dehydrogenase, beta subunit C-terminal domain [Rhodococcus fascians]